MPAINFYILSPGKPLPHFVCQLIETGLNKSPDDLLLLTPSAQLASFDELLWAFDATSFIPHDILTADGLQTPLQANGSGAGLTARVQLTDNPAHVTRWVGAVVNITDLPVTDFGGTKLLEVIAADALENGRQKYRHYQSLYPQTKPKTFQI